MEKSLGGPNIDAEIGSLSENFGDVISDSFMFLPYGTRGVFFLDSTSRNNDATNT